MHDGFLLKAMNCFRGLPLIALLLLFASTHVQADLRLASWNIANLSEVGVEFRGYERTQADIDQIAAKIQSFDADIIALQEVTSISIAKEVLGDKYHLQFEKRCHALQTEEEVEPCGQRDIYTVIAYHERIKSLVCLLYTSPSPRDS